MSADPTVNGTSAEWVPDILADRLRHELPAAVWERFSATLASAGWTVREFLREHLPETA